eukprot:10135780-Alexandrium_andersonii.AAC.1
MSSLSLWPTMQTSSLQLHTLHGDDQSRKVVFARAIMSCHTAHDVRPQRHGQTPVRASAHVHFKETETTHARERQYKSAVGSI